MSERARAMVVRLVSAGLALAFASIPAPGSGPGANRREPGFLCVEPGTGSLLVLCEGSGTIARIDPATGTIESEMPVGEEPFALAVAPGGQHLYVSCRRGQEVVELDATTLETVRRFPLRGDPTGVEVSADGRRLYAGVHSLDQVAVFDLDTGAEIRRLAAGNGPQMLRRSPQGRIFVTNLLSNPVPPGTPSRLEISVIDDGVARVVDRIILVNANVGRHIAFTSDGTAVVAISRPKNLVPMVQVARGWVITNGFALMEPDGAAEPVQLLLDLPNQAYSDPYGVAVTPDDGKVYVTAAGVDTVLAIDLDRARAVAAEAAAGLIPRHADSLGLSRRYVVARIEVGANPHAIVIGDDGRRAYVVNRLDDSISVIDTATDEVVDTFVLGDPPSPGLLDQGKHFFHSAGRTFQNQFACASCHPDRGVDGLQYDLEPDGLGRNILDNRNLRGLRGTAPFKWVGTNPDIATQCGTRTAKWITRTGWLSSTEVVALSEYIRSIPPVVNPYLAADGRLTAAQARGRTLFERTTTNDGGDIPERDQCHFCHSGPNLTNYQRFDVGTRASSDKEGTFDSAHLLNVFDSPPFLHDGRAATLEEIWTRYNPDDTHGISSDWTKQQLNDLIEYLKVAGSERESGP